jgi:hypothetical protein
VLAVGRPISDRAARDFFEEVTARVAGGAPPAAALRDARVAFLKRPATEWVQEVVLFQ